MRSLLELCLLILLILAGWNQPFRDHVRALFPGANIAPSRTAQIAARNAGVAIEPPPAEAAGGRRPSGNRNWMWEEKPMDKPRPANGTVR